MLFKVSLEQPTACSELTRTAGVSVEVLQEGQESVRGDTVDRHHSTPGLSVLPAEHGRHDITASHQHRPVGRQHAPWEEGQNVQVQYVTFRT